MRLQNGDWITIPKWDCIIAHPPCTYLSNSAVAQHSLKSAPENRIEGRTKERIKAMQFFMEMITAPCDHIAVENPVGIMNTAFRKPDQIIEPYQFADSKNDTENYVTKRTCLWLKNLPELKTNSLERPNNSELYGRNSKGKPFNFTEGHAKLPKQQSWGSIAHRDPIERAKTFPGIAKAIAEQWGEYLNDNYKG